ncbi:hypothetical protein SDC9_130927 [bioreactor metagenome]|uniref:Uncharacterized protein n=1 Tax=bioreactor metagenome TaxID=1076179 RepID=A0A645D467_9ZZZZ
MIRNACRKGASSFEINSGRRWPDSAAENALQQGARLDRLVFLDFGRGQDPGRVQALGLRLDHIAHQQLLACIVAGKDQAAFAAEQAKARRRANGRAVDGHFGEIGDRQLAELRRGRKVACVVRCQALGQGRQAGAGGGSQQGAAPKATAEAGGGAAVHGVYPGADRGAVRAGVMAAMP